MRTMQYTIVVVLGCLPACGASGVDADNTKKNARDRDGDSITPIDQGNSAADLEVTQKIRQALVADKGLSSNAHNVKIITKDGAVTLRGPVKDEAEKARVVGLARNIAGQAPMTVQIESETKSP